MNPPNWSPSGFHIMIKPVGAQCNLKCEYCFYLDKKSLYPQGSFMLSEEILEKFTKEYIESQSVKEINFAWQGGEPLLWGLSFFKKAIQLQQKYAKRGIIIRNTLQTNGTMLTDAWGQFLAENKFLVGISIDGPAKLHNKFRKDTNGEGTLKRVIRGLNILKKYNIDFNVLSCVHSGNVEHPVELYRYLRDELKAEFIQFIPIVKYRSTGQNNINKRDIALNDPYTVDPKKFGKFLNTIFDEWVRNDVGKVFVQIFDATLAGWMRISPGVCIFSPVCGHALAMEHNGDIYACDHYVKPDFKRGNILSKSLIDSVGSETQYQFGLAKTENLPNTCKKCKYLGLCYGGCPRNRIFVPEKEKFPLNYLCFAYKEFFAHIEPYMLFMRQQLLKQQPAASIMEYLKKYSIEEFVKFKN